MGMLISCVGMLVQAASRKYHEYAGFKRRELGFYMTYGFSMLN